MFARTLSIRVSARALQGIGALLVLVVALGVTLLFSASSAVAAAPPMWTIKSVALPSILHPSQGLEGTAKFTVTAENVGGATDGSAITLADVLPPGLTATELIGYEQELDGYGSTPGRNTSMNCTLETLTCTYGGAMPAGDTLTVTLKVRVGENAGDVTNTAAVSGGGVTGASVEEPVAISSTAGEFGIEPGSSTSTYNNADGSFDTQAGSSPYSATTGFVLNSYQDPTFQGGSNLFAPILDGEPKEIVVELPPGFSGNPNVVPQCTNAQLEDIKPYGANSQGGACPADTQVGITSLLLGGLETGVQFTLPVYDMVPTTGEVARFAFLLYGEVINIEIAIRTSSDYGLTATVSGITQIAPPLDTSLTLWGVPADPSHNWQRVIQGSCEIDCAYGSSSDVQPKPFITTPSSCGGSLLTTFSMDSWENPGVYLPPSPSVQPPLSGCGLLSFAPSLSVTPETSAVDSPTGLSVDLHVPQNEDDPNALATPDLQNATVTLPAGLSIAPGAANGLQGCTPSQIGIGSASPVSCPDASKLGTVQVASPGLPRGQDGSEGTLNGSIYLGEPESGSIGGPPYTIYLDLEGYGLSVRLAGSVSPDPVTGQLTATFMNNPQLPFDELKLHFFGGPRAALATPPVCGSFTTTSSLTPFSSSVAATPSSVFTTSFDGNGAACPSPLPFAPSFGAGSTSTTAGAFSAFVLNIARADGQQALSRISLTTPPGLLGMLSGIPLCGEPQAAQGTCSASSQIGTATAAAGAGPEPFTVSGPVYLTGPYKGAPFGLSIAVPAAAGPFNLGTVVVRSAIYVDSHDAHLLVVSDPLPQMVDTSQGDSGIPVALQSVSVNIDRPGFIFNPTNCTPTALGGTLSSTQGATAAVSSPFQVGGCASLAFHPTFAVSTSGKTSKADGASLNVKLTYPSAPQDRSEIGQQANIAKVKVDLPKQLPSRLTTLQKACTAAVFEANPAACPAASVIGIVKVHTPVLPVELSGPVYFVSHGGEAFPSLEMVLQGYGVSVDVVGATFISKAGITSTTFKTVPDVPFSSFELYLPEGKFSALGTNKNLCKEKLSMPTAFVAQNGAEIHQNTKITVTGCPKTKKKVKAARKKAKATNTKSKRRAKR
jgi:hypothetical protein